MRTLAKLAKIELKLFLREPLTVIFAVAFPALVIIVLGSVFGNAVDPEEADVWRGTGPMNYYVPGYVGLAIASIGLIGIPVHLASYRERGVLRRLHASAVPAWTILGAQIAVAFVAGLVGSVILLAIGFIGFGVSVPEQPLGVAFAFVLTVLAFASLGFLLGAVMPSARAAQGLGLILFFVMMFLSGTDGPREVMGETLRRIGDFLPLTHVIVALQDPWLGFGTNWARLGIVVGVLVASGALAVRAFRWE